MSGNMDNVGKEVTQKVMAEIAQATNQKNIVEEAGRRGNQIAQNELEKRMKRTSEKATKEMKVKIENSIRTAASKARQTVTKAAGDIASAPTGGVSKVAAEKTAQADKKATEAKNKSETQKAKTTNNAKSGMGQKLTGAIKSKAQKNMKLTSQKGLIEKTSKGAGKANPTAVISSKVKGTLKESLTPKMGEKENKQEER